MSSLFLQSQYGQSYTTSRPPTIMPKLKNNLHKVDWEVPDDVEILYYRGRRDENGYYSDEGESEYYTTDDDEIEVPYRSNGVPTTLKRCFLCRFMFEFGEEYLQCELIRTLAGHWKKPQERALTDRRH